MVGEPPLSVPAHASVFFPFCEEHFRGKFQRFFVFLKDNQGATDAGPTVRTLAGTREKLAGMRVDMPWSAISQESNQPDHSTEINVHGHG